MLNFPPLFIKKTQSALAWIVGFFVLASIGLTIGPLFQPGLPATHDGEGHVARAANYAAALRQYQFPPRWAPSFWNGFGYPIFNFHYPLLSILTTPLILADLHPEIAIKVWLGLSILITSFSFLLSGYLLRRKQASQLGLLVLLLSPYFFNLLYVRGSYGEVLAYTAISLICLSVVLYQKLHSKWRVPISTFFMFSSTAALCLAHNITVMLVLPFLTLFGLMLFLRQRTTLPLLVSFGAGVLSSSFFWIPALLEKKFTVIDEVANPFSEHFATMSQLFHDTVEQGVSVAGPGDTISFAVGTLTLIVLVSLALWGRNQKQNKTHHLLTAGLFISVICLWLATASSMPVWQLIPLLQYVQFPWRLVGLATLLVSWLTVFYWPSKKHTLALFTTVVSAALLINRSSWPVRPAFHHDPAYYFGYVQTSTIWDEIRAKTWHMEVFNVSSIFPTATPAAEITIEKWRGSYRRYQVKSSQPTLIIEPTMYFPGWETQLNDATVRIDTQVAKGQIAFQVPAGTHAIETRFTQNTLPRQLGNSISAIAVGGFIGFWSWLGWIHVISHHKRSRATRDLEIT